MISLRNVHVVFGEGTANENCALKGINLEVPEGTFLTVIGSNGAGKSTLLNAISGTIPVASGEISVDGVPISRLREHNRSGICARVFQDPLVGTCGPLTIEENLALALDRGKKRSLLFAMNGKRRKLFRDTLASLGLGLEDRLTDRMDLLSGGQRQAVSLVMATLAPCEVLLLDEHTAALDPVMADVVIKLTNRVLKEQGLTALMITHSMSQALTYGDRLIMMHRGRIAIDLDAEARSNMTVENLVDEFSKQVGGSLDQDNLLL